VPKEHGKRLSSAQVLSSEQVEKLLRRARAAISQKKLAVGSPTHTVPDLWALELVTEEDQLEAMAESLGEITHQDYSGPDPPNHLSGEPRCKGERMLQFVWKSTYFKGRRMCIKFCLQDDYFVLIRIHIPYDPNKFKG
jgi:hypothetical protein